VVSLGRRPGYATIKSFFYIIFSDFCDQKNRFFQKQSAKIIFLFVAKKTDFLEFSEKIGGGGFCDFSVAPKKTEKKKNRPSPFFCCRTKKDKTCKAMKQQIIACFFAHVFVSFGPFFE
jgi:hypothetical protein